MRKLKLNLNELSVASFETGEEITHRGTVMGNKTPPPTDFTCYTRDGDYSCAYTCNCTGGSMCVSQMTDGCGGCSPESPY